jgi:hypothetical protein
MNNAFRPRNGKAMPAAARSDRPGERAHDGSHDGYPRCRELAHRCNDGLDVTLFWHPASDEVTLRGYDRRSGVRFEIHPERHSALDAFYHPYVYVTSNDLHCDDDRLAA